LSTFFVQVVETKGNPLDKAWSPRTCSAAHQEAGADGALTRQVSDRLGDLWKQRKQGLKCDLEESKNEPPKQDFRQNQLPMQRSHGVRQHGMFPKCKELWKRGHALHKVQSTEWMHEWIKQQLRLKMSCNLFTPYYSQLYCLAPSSSLISLVKCCSKKAKNKTKQNKKIYPHPSQEVSVFREKIQTKKQSPLLLLEGPNLSCRI
jgi:hypothetical protein